MNTTSKYFRSGCWWMAVSSFAFCHNPYHPVLIPIFPRIVLPQNSPWKSTLQKTRVYYTSFLTNLMDYKFIIFGNGLGLCLASQARMSSEIFRLNIAMGFRCSNFLLFTMPLLSIFLKQMDIDKPMYRLGVRKFAELLGPLTFILLGAAAL